jgi:hypothetical protein
MEIDLTQISRNEFMSSRIPAQDALETFVSTGSENEGWIQAFNQGSSRWYPVEGGHRVLISYRGGLYDDKRFSLVSGAWDHEHCMNCRDKIESMTVCWVTKVDPYILLCNNCFHLIPQNDGTGAA